MELTIPQLHTIAESLTTYMVDYVRPRTPDKLPELQHLVDLIEIAINNQMEEI